MLTITLNEILKHNPCGQYTGSVEGFGFLLKNLCIGGLHDKPITIIQILESNGIGDAIWALRCFDYKDCCLFLNELGKITKHKLETLDAITAHDVACTAADYAYDAAADAVTGRETKWTEIEVLFIKHFGEQL